MALSRLVGATVAIVATARSRRSNNALTIRRILLQQHTPLQALDWPSNTTDQLRYCCEFGGMFTTLLNLNDATWIAVCFYMLLFHLRHDNRSSRKPNNHNSCWLEPCFQPYRFERFEKGSERRVLFAFTPPTESNAHIPPCSLLSYYAPYPDHYRSQCRPNNLPPTWHCL
jgi:hypothetical protein